MLDPHSPADDNINQTKKNRDGNQPDADHNRHQDRGGNERPSIPTSLKQEEDKQNVENAQGQGCNNPHSPATDAPFRNSILTFQNPK